MLPLQVTYQHMQLEAWDVYLAAQKEVQAFKTAFVRLRNMGCSDGAQRICFPQHAGLVLALQTCFREFQLKLLGVSGAKNSQECSLETESFVPFRLFRYSSSVLEMIFGSFTLMIDPYE